MKKFSLWALLLMFSIIGLQSCKEDIVADEGQSQDDLSGMTARGGAPSAISKLSYKDRLGNKQDILSFATKADFTNTLSELERLYNENSDDENEYDSVLNFDNEFGFKSLLLDYVAAEESWLMTEDLPDATDPDNLFYDLDIEELALLNKERAVKIGDDILVYFKDGFVGIRNSNFSVIKDVAAYNSLFELYQDSQNHSGTTARTSFWGWLFWPITWADIELDYDGGDLCREQRSWNKHDKINGIKYKMKVKYKRYNAYLFKNAKIKAKFKTFKKQWFWWKKIKTNKKITVTGNSGIGECNIYSALSFGVNDEYEYRKVLPREWDGGHPTVNFYVQDNYVNANYYSDGVLIHSVDLYDGHFNY